MKRQLTAVLVGAGGYGKVYLQHLPQGSDEEVILTAVVDPFLEKSPDALELVRQRRLSVYDSLEAFYQEHSADLVILVTPLPMHLEQCVTAMAHGSHVLCEKPLVPVLQDVPKLQAEVEHYGKILAVAFQWDYLPAILRVKELYGSGRLGRAVRMKSYISWPRSQRYYQRGWAAKVRDGKGNYILDAIVTNAVAHYIQVMLYILGEGYGQAEEIRTCQAALYRANPIETYDTAALKAQTMHGTELYFYATHASNYQIDPMFIYEFEEATVTMNAFDRGSQVTIFYRDGQIEELEGMGPDLGTVMKVKALAQVIQNGGEIPSPIGASVSTIRLANGLLDFVPIHSFDPALVKFDQEKQSWLVPGLHLDLYQCYEQWKLPTELGFSWAEAETSFSLEGYDHFEGRLV